ncbi:MAG: adenine nucleotide alpha hydrolase [Deltaproteobacteria bacterium]|nr:adenine nucleotide alpha hydrolase [Deltaproteobacteria bacterium]
MAREEEGRPPGPAAEVSAGGGRPEPALLCWSGGKDSAMALHRLVHEGGRYTPVGLLTTVTEVYDRISMHGVRRSLLRRQARSLGLPVEEVVLSPHSSNEEYEALMEDVLVRWKRKGVNSVVFGDIFLEDIRKYREENLNKVGMRAVFPLWGQDTSALAEWFLASGFRAVVTCVDSRVLAGSFAGRYMDEAFFSDLPEGVDPCGENGEFHSFVVDGPIFRKPMVFTVGKTVLRDGFYFCDLLPA